MNPLVEAGARALEWDATDDQSMPTAVQSIVRVTGRIDRLIKNAIERRKRRMGVTIQQVGGANVQAAPNRKLKTLGVSL